MTANPAAPLAAPCWKCCATRCELPYALEGLLRREIEAVGASLTGIEHGEQVSCVFRLAENEAPALIARLNEAGQGRVVWLGAAG